MIEKKRLVTEPLFLVGYHIKMVYKESYLLRFCNNILVNRLICSKKQTCRMKLLCNRFYRCIDKFHRLRIFLFHLYHHNHWRIQKCHIVLSRDYILCNDNMLWSQIGKCHILDIQIAKILNIRIRKCEFCSCLLFYHTHIPLCRNR